MKREINSSHFPGTIAEDYLVKYRKISPETIDNLELRFMEANEEYQDEIRGDVIANPALVVPVINPKGELTGIQRIFLTPKSGERVTGYDYAKKSKGLLKGSAGIIQRGNPGDVLYIGEGPETAASVASVKGPEVTVFASMSVSLLKWISESVLAANPKIVILAADRDARPAAKEATMEGFRHLEKVLVKNDIVFHLVLPSLGEEENEKRKNVDFNDVLKELGPNVLFDQLTP